MMFDDRDESEYWAAHDPQLGSFDPARDELESEWNARFDYEAELRREHDDTAALRAEAEADHVAWIIAEAMEGRVDMSMRVPVSHYLLGDIMDDMPF